jgi:tetrahydromethanopterin S-methyltransferase subunit G
MTTNERLDEIQSRLNNIEARFNNMDTRLNNLDSHLNDVENRLTAVNPQLRQQLDRIEQGGRRNFFYGGLALSITAIIYAYNLLTASPPNKLGIVIAVPGVFLCFGAIWNLYSIYRRQ